MDFEKKIIKEKNALLLKSRITLNTFILQVKLWEKVPSISSTGTVCMDIQSLRDTKIP